MIEYVKGWINQTLTTGLEGAIFCSFILRTFSGLKIKERNIASSKPMVRV